MNSIALPAAALIVVRQCEHPDVTGMHTPSYALRSCITPLSFKAATHSRVGVQSVS